MDPKGLGRLAASLIAAMALVGCRDDPKPRTTISWDIIHIDFDTGQESAVDCASAGVEEVSARFYCLGGGSADWSGPCSQGSVTLDPVAGQACRIQVSGRTAGGWLYGLGGNAHVAAQGEHYRAALLRFGSRLTIQPSFSVWDGTAYAPVASPSCTGPGVDYLTYEVVNEVGDLQARGQLDCSGDPAASSLPGKSAGAFGRGEVEVGYLSIDVRGWRRTDPPTLVMTSCPLVVEHTTSSWAVVVPVPLRGPLPISCP